MFSEMLLTKAATAVCVSVSTRDSARDAENDAVTFWDAVSVMDSDTAPKYTVSAANGS